VNFYSLPFTPIYIHQSKNAVMLYSKRLQPFMLSAKSGIFIWKMRIYTYFNLHTIAYFYVSN